MHQLIVLFCLLWKFCESCSGSASSNISTLSPFEVVDVNNENKKDGSVDPLMPIGPTPKIETIIPQFVSKKDSLPVFVVAFDKSSKTAKDSNKRKTIVIRATEKSGKDWGCHKPRIEPIDWSNPKSRGSIVMGHDNTNSFLVACGVKINEKQAGCQKLVDNNWIKIDAPFPEELVPSDDMFEQLTFVFTYIGIWSAKNILNKNNETWMLNLISEKWIKSVTLPDIRSDFCVVSKYFKKNDDTMIIGGLDQKQKALRSVYQRSWQHIHNTKWNSKKDMPEGRHGMACGWNNDKVYVVGGFTKDQKHDEPEQDVMVFNVDSNKWTNGISLTQGNGVKGLEHNQVYFYHGSPFIVQEKKFLRLEDGKWGMMDEREFPPLHDGNSIMTEVVGEYLPETCYKISDGMEVARGLQDEDDECWLYPCPKEGPGSGWFSLPKASKNFRLSRRNEKKI